MTICLPQCDLHVLTIETIQSILSSHAQTAWVPCGLIASLLIVISFPLKCTHHRSNWIAG